ncbi:IU_nuc_hydro domain-containing protein/TFIID_20kDa domain-containing protein [Cephalotus follicularis]|uniref:Inosine nucleosidase n=1 Tax=Cephalotus follicularis TaxID=3775 RepID=A0A1Q3BDW8_CEPFO|nr:IU_nuc_hydro domain-containing protein/TFIID_20kDa domain-containing protein [Cephalotus follicularis]
MEPQETPAPIPTTTTTPSTTTPQLTEPSPPTQQQPPSSTPTPLPSSPNPNPNPTTPQPQKPSTPQQPPPSPSLPQQQQQQQLTPQSYPRPTAAFPRTWQQQHSHFSQFSSAPLGPTPAPPSVSTPPPRSGMAIGVPASHPSPSPAQPPPFSSGQQFGVLGRTGVNVPDSVSNSNNAQVRPGMQPVQGSGMIPSSLQMRSGGVSAHPQQRPVQSSPSIRPPSSPSNQSLNTQSFQGHSALRVSSAGSPVSPAPNASQNMQSGSSLNQPWLSSVPQGKPPLPPPSYRAQMNSPSMPQRSHIPLQHPPLPTASQQQHISPAQPPQPPPSHQPQEHYGQQFPPPRVTQSINHQLQMSRVTASGNQKPSSPTVVQPNIALQGIAPSEKLDPEVEDILVDIAEEFVDSITTFGCSLAKHRKSDTLEAKDILLHLERNWNMTLPGFSDEIKTFRKPNTIDIHKERLAVIKKSIVATEFASAKNFVGHAVTNAKAQLFNSSQLTKPPSLTCNQPHPTPPTKPSFFIYILSACVCTHLYSLAFLFSSLIRGLPFLYLLLYLFFFKGSGDMNSHGGVLDGENESLLPSFAKREKLIIDTDPGIDDSIAIFMAFQNPELEVLGLTTIFGNVTTEDATRNALLLCEIAGFPGVPVAEGSPEPLKGGRPRVADFVHGSDGLGNIFLPPPKAKKSEKNASEFLVDTVSKYPGEVSILALGPLTNLALAIKRDSSFASKVKKIVVLGGAFFALGNVSPAAEANIYGDPDAADIVFTSGADIVVVGINITTQVLLTDADLLEWRQSKGRHSLILSDMCKFYRDWHVKSDGVYGIFLHDPVSYVALVRPDLFSYKKGVVRVETQGICVGHTLMDQGLKKWNANNPWSGYSPISVAWTVDVVEVLNYIRKTIMKS